MTISVKHKFQSAKADGTDATLVQPSAWNDDHTLNCSADKVIGRVTGGTGPAEEIACTSTGRQLLSAASTAAVASLLGVSSLPAGVIAPFAGVSPPSGWLLCDGSAVSRTTYATLFSAIGSTWGGGNGSSTFNLPSLQGAFLRGAGGAGGTPGGGAGGGGSAYTGGTAGAGGAGGRGEIWVITYEQDPSTTAGFGFYLG